MVDGVALDLPVIAMEIGAALDEGIDLRGQHGGGTKRHIIVRAIERGGEATPCRGLVVGAIEAGIDDAAGQADGGLIGHLLSTATPAS